MACAGSEQSNNSLIKPSCHCWHGTLNTLSQKPSCDNPAHFLPLEPDASLVFVGFREHGGAAAAFRPPFSVSVENLIDLHVKKANTAVANVAGANAWIDYSWHGHGTA
jgi:hypothetical protein